MSWQQPWGGGPVFDYSEETGLAAFYDAAVKGGWFVWPPDPMGDELGYNGTAELTGKAHDTANI